MKNKKITLSMRGGGARVGAYLGVLKALEEADLEVDMIIGSSGGAIVGSAYASGMSYSEIADAFRDINLKDVLSIVDQLKGRTLFSTERVEDYLKKYIGDPNFSDLKIPLFIQVTNMRTLQSEIFGEGRVLDSLMGSLAIPRAFKNKELNGIKYADGDLSSGFEASFLREKGAKFILGLDCLFQFEGHTDDLSAQFTEILSVPLTNLLRLYNELDPVDFRIGYLGKKATPLDFHMVDELMEDGYQKTVDHLPEILDKLNSKN